MRRIIVLLFIYLNTTWNILFPQTIQWKKVTSTGHLVYDMITNQNKDIVAATFQGGVNLSSNQGTTWYMSNSGLTQQNLYTAFRNIKNDIFIGTGGHGVFRSTNDGKSWFPAGLSCEYINAIVINSENELYAGTFFQGVFFSSDNGATWINRSSGLPTCPVMVMLINKQGDVFVSLDVESQKIFRSTDKGLSWQSTSIGLSGGTFWNMTLKSSGFIFIGNTTGVYRSTNNGDSWTKVNNGLPSTPHVYALSSNSSGDIFASIYNYGIYSSTNDGVTWREQNDRLTNKQIMRLLVDEAGYIYGAALSTEFFRSENPTITNILISNSGEIDDYSLYQNYPNPFNPSTRIQYQVSSNSNVTLKVYDVLGNEVATLVDEYKPAGRYEVEFSASSGIMNLASGIYFYYNA